VPPSISSVPPYGGANVANYFEMAAPERRHLRGRTCNTLQCATRSDGGQAKRRACVGIYSRRAIGASAQRAPVSRRPKSRGVALRRSGHRSGADRGRRGAVAPARFDVDQLAVAARALRLQLGAEPHALAGRRWAQRTPCATARRCRPPAGACPATRRKDVLVDVLDPDALVLGRILTAMRMSATGAPLVLSSRSARATRDRPRYACAPG